MKDTDDQRILELFAERNEAALRQLSQKYGGACRKLAAQILGSEQDAEEVLNDALLRLWNAIPPQKPDDLFRFLCRTVRNLALERVRSRKRQKRGGGLPEFPLDSPAAQQLASPENVETLLDYSLTVDSVNRFLRTLPPDACSVFIMRYGRGCSVKEIAGMFDFTQSKVLVTLLRTRNQLRKWLENEGYL